MDCQSLISSRQLRVCIALNLRIWERVDVHHPIFTAALIWVCSTRGTLESNGLSSLSTPKSPEDVAFSQNLPFFNGEYTSSSSIAGFRGHSIGSRASAPAHPWNRHPPQRHPPASRRPGWSHVPGWVSKRHNPTHPKRPSIEAYRSGQAKGIDVRRR